MEDVTFLQGLWFVLICVLWVGYFVLEGFDFGVGMLLRVVGRDDRERRAVLHTIGPVWDGNEVWLIVAGGATFAAFPQWYATLFSGFYLALFLILGALIVRGITFELWGKRSDRAWRTRWEWAMIISSGLAALLWGVGWANIVGGVPIGADGEYSGTLFDLLNPYALLGGVATLAIFFAHGANFLTLRTKDAVKERAHDVARRSTPLAAALGTAFLVWTLIDQSDRGGIEAVSAILAIAAVAGLWAAVALTRRGAAAASFGATTAGIGLLFASLFTDLFPNAMVSSTSSAYDLTLSAASSSDYTLTVMTVVAVVLLPVVLAYQAWTYWVFRHRVGADDHDRQPTPMDVIERRFGPGDEPDEPDQTKPAGTS